MYTESAEDAALPEAAQEADSASDAETGHKDAGTEGGEASVTNDAPDGLDALAGGDGVLDSEGALDALSDAAQDLGEDAGPLDAAADGSQEACDDAAIDDEAAAPDSTEPEDALEDTSTNEPDVLVCGPAQSVCAGQCVDLQSDPAHCGGCGTPCQPAEQCLEGLCRPCSQAPLLPGLPALGLSGEFVAFGDLDGDGRDELAFSGSGLGFIGIAPNPGHGTLGPAVPYPGSASALAWADMNGDGWADLVSTLQAVVTVRMNQGGTLGPPSSYPVGNSYNSAMVVGDVNGDAMPDVVVARGLQVQVLVNQGDGSLGPAAGYAVPFPVWALGLGDLDGDGLAELAVGYASQPLTGILHNLGAGGYSPPVDLPGAAYAIVFEDFNGDGCPDFAAGGFSLSIYFNDANGWLGAPTVYPVKSEVMVAVDYDLDGDLDLACAMNSEASIVFNAGDGTFAPGPSQYAAYKALSISAGDVTGDGYPELAVGSPRWTPVLLNLGNGAFPSPAVPLPNVFGARAVVVGDLDGNGALDAVVGFSNSLKVLLNAGGGMMVDAFELAVGDGGAWPGVVLHDLNGDGLLDIASAHAGPGINVWLNQGAGVFSASVVWPSGSLPFRLAAADVNGDGIQDLVTGNLGGSASVSIWLGTGDGGFLAPYSYGGLAEFSTVIARDLNGDASPDIVVCTGSQCLVRLNAGNGTFPSWSIHAVGKNSLRTAVEDLNGDGAADIAAACDDGVEILWNAGSGSFSAKELWPHGLIETPLWGVVAGDINGDGLPDLVTNSSPFSNSVSVLLNEGEGHFTRSFVYAVGGKPNELALGDLDGDGRLDVVCATTEPGALSLLFNRGQACGWP